MAPGLLGVCNMSVNFVPVLSSTCSCRKWLVLFWLSSHFQSCCLAAGQVKSGFGQMEENSRSRWDVWHAFILGWVSHARCRPCVPPREVLTPLYTKCTQSQQVPKYYITELDSAHADPYSRVLSHSCLDVQVREHDWLHFPYNPPFQSSSPYNLREDVFGEGPLVRRAEPCTHVPQ